MNMAMAGKEKVLFSATTILDNLEKIILPEAKAENGLLCCFEEGTQKLKGNIVCIKDMLLHADQENGSIRIPYIRMQRWLRELMDVLDEADILVNDIKGEIHKSKSQIPESHAHGAVRKVSNFFSFNVQMAIRIRAINNKLNDQIAFHEVAATHGDAIFQLAKRPQKSPFLPDHLDRSKIIGRDKDVENIVRVLVDPTKGYGLGLTVLPILGTQGLGKTTLAGLVYNHEMVNKFFELKIWVPIENYDLMELVRRILESVGYRGSQEINHVESEVMHKNFYHMVQVLLHYLGGRRYLLVLDGWEVNDLGTWMDLKDLLMNGANGSKIIVTTRRRDVAQLMGAIPPYILQGLSMEDSLSLLFQGSLVSVSPDLEDIGMKIVEKCQGVPSDIKKMGKRLDWNSVRDSEMWEKPQLIKDLLVLKTSYYDDPLDEKFKECFKHCSFFPQNHEFNTLELIQFWDAYDLLGIGSNYEGIEATGMAGLESLLSRSWLQVCGEEFFYQKFKIPPLQYQLAHTFLVQHEFKKMNSSSISIEASDESIPIQHFLFDGSDSEFSSQQDNWSVSLKPRWWFHDIISSIKTLIFFAAEKIGKYLMESFIGQSTDLRVLILRDSSLKVLPSGIKGLKNLKYLDLTGNKQVKEVPNSICMLYNLQTLILEGCVKVKELPRDIRYLGGRLTMLVITTKQRFLPENGVGKLTSLRYLAIIGCPELKYLPQGIFLLTSLRTFIIRDCRSLISLPRSIKSMMALETLVISNCQELLLRTEFDGDENPYLGHLHGTGLSLRRLWIAKLPKLSALPQWFFGKSLEQLHIEDCQELKIVPRWLEDLTSLANIHILRCQNLSYPGITLSSSILKNARIEDCPHLAQPNETQIATNTNKGAKGKGVRFEYYINFEAAEPATSSLGLQNWPLQLQREKSDAGAAF